MCNGACNNVLYYAGSLGTQGDILLVICQVVIITHFPRAVESQMAFFLKAVSSILL